VGQQKGGKLMRYPLEMIKFNRIMRFGRENLYPANEAAELLMSMVDRVCFDPNKLWNLQQLNIPFEVIDIETPEEE